MNDGAPAERREGVSRVDLFVVSFLSLFLEMAMIRWLPSQVRILSYYANIALLSAFLGLAVGCLWGERRRRLFAWAAPVLAAGILVAVAMPRLLEAIARAGKGWLNALATGTLLAVVAGLVLLVLVRGFRRTQSRRPVLLVAAVAVVGLAGLGVSVARHGGLAALHAGYHVWEVPENQMMKMALVPIMFAVNVAVFLPIGYLVGRCFEHHPPIVAYTINVLGAVLGVAVLSAVSYLGAPPIVWFGLAFASFLYLLRGAGGKALAGTVVSGAAALALVAAADRGTIWSPYYNIRLRDWVLSGQRVGSLLEVNNNFHQYSVDLSDEGITVDRTLRDLRDYYDMPYRLVQPQSVLIVGAGTGNDIAAALRAGVRRIDAVEIDPTIAALGDQHPEHPYRNPAVRRIVDDARSYFRTTTRRYDLIVFGLLDSQRLLSYMSSVRLDSYVYTRESLAEAARLLTPAGVISLSFSVGKPWLGTRIARTIREATHTEPLVAVFQSMFHVNTMFLYSPSGEQMARMRAARLPEEMRFTAPEPVAGIEAATDDWPYFYTQSRGISNVYLATILVLVVLSALFIMAVAPAGERDRSSAVEGTAPSFRGAAGNVTLGRFFWLGAAFMLLETRSLTALSLLFGSTWVVNSLVIGTILVMIVAANLIIQRTRLSDLRVWYVLLFASLALNYLVPASGRFFSQGTVHRVLAAGLVALPLFFAAFIFGISFRSSKRPPADLGANLLGSVTGGLVEYFSLVTGLNALYLVAGAFYALSAATGRGRQSGQGAGVSGQGSESRPAASPETRA